LFSGGKDSCRALELAMQKEEVCCLISVISENKESYMFHTPNVELTKLQAEAIGLPLVQVKTKGNKEEELVDLMAAIQAAISSHRIEGIVTGAIESVYQAERVQRIASELGLWCFNPLWKKDQALLVRELIISGYEVMISGVFAYPLDETFLGRMIDMRLLDELIRLQQKFRISPSGEGGEIETTVLHAPFFKKRIKVEGKPLWDGRSGVFMIERADLV